MRDEWIKDAFLSLEESVNVMPDPEIPIELHNWLRIVTMDLSRKEDKAEASGDLISRYYELFEQYLKQGWPEPQAKERAIMALGDPWIKRNELKNSHHLFHLHRTWEKGDVHKTLELWLKIALSDLEGADRERLQAEYLNHYEDAFASEREDGKSAAEAQMIALDSLGDPLQVNNKLRRSFLNKSEQIV